MLSPDEEAALLKGATLDAAKAFYSSFLGASAAELVMVGDFDNAEAQKLAADLFGAWKSPKPHTRIPFAYKPVETIDRWIETPDKANALVVAGVPLQITDTHPDYPALLLGNYMLGGSMSSRLFSRIRTKEGLSYGVNSTLTVRAVSDGGAFMFSAIAAPQNVPKVEATFKEELLRALKEGFDPAEVDQAKKGWLQRQTVSRGQDNELVGILSSNAYNDRTMAFQAELEKKIAALTPEKVAETVRRYFDPARLSFVKAGDFKKAGVGK